MIVTKYMMNNKHMNETVAKIKKIEDEIQGLKQRLEIFDDGDCEDEYEKFIESGIFLTKTRLKKNKENYM